MESKLNNAWNVYNQIQQGISFADTKAQLVLGIVGIIATVAVTALVDLAPGELFQRPLQLVLLLLGSLSGTLSIYYGFRCINPTLDFIVGQKESPIFFGNISEKYPQALTYIQKMETVDDAAYIQEIYNQIWVNSKIATAKYKAVRQSIQWLLITVFITILGVLSTLFI